METLTKILTLKILLRNIEKQINSEFVTSLNLFHDLQLHFKNNITITTSNTSNCSPKHSKSDSTATLVEKKEKLEQIIEQIKLESKQVNQIYTIEEKIQLLAKIYEEIRRK